MSLTAINIEKDTLKDFKQAKDTYNAKHPKTRCVSHDDFLRRLLKSPKRTLKKEL